MKHLLPALFLLALTATSCGVFKKKPEPVAPAAYSARTGADRNQIYSEQYATAAVLEMQRLGVPASITLAQGILESGAGTSELAKNANNHFGIKCGNNWTGETYKKKDDDRDANGDLKESCFRKYTRVEESYLDHGQFLRDPRKDQRYGFLFRLDPTDYKGWAQGLQAAGYSTSNTYADKLVDIIERYKLYEYDLPGNKKANELPDPEKPQSGTDTDADIALPTASNRVGRINNVKVVVAREGESITNIAKTYRLSPDKIAEYNDRGYTPIQKLKANTRVFIDTKRDKWTASSASDHIVKKGQTMFDISQTYGLKLDKLLTRNGLSRGQEPAEGTRIYLNSKRPSKDPVTLRSDDDSSNSSTGDSGKPNEYWPTAPSPSTMTPDEDGLLDEIAGGDADKKPAPTPSTTPATPDKPTTGAPVPVVTGSSGYPPVVVDTPTTTKPPTPPVAAPGTHIVVKGDTLTNIAKRYYTSVARLMQINNLRDANIKIGQTLKVK